MDQRKAINDLSGPTVAERISAAEFLSQLTGLTDEGALALLEACADQDEQVREWAVAGLESMEEPNSTLVNALGERLSHPSDDVAYWAATLLGRLSSAADASCQNLIAVLDDEQASLTVRERAAWALGKIGVSPNSAAALQWAARSEHSRLASVAKGIVDG